MRIDRPIAIALILFVIVVLIFFLVAPEYKTFKDLRQDLGEKKAQYNAEFDYYVEITKKYYELKNYEEGLKKIDDALPQDPNLGKIIYYFEKTASDSGLIIKDLFLSSVGATDSDKKNKNKTKNLIFSLDLMGTYSSLGSFLDALEISDKIFEVTSISFQSGDELTSLKPSQKTQIQIYNFNLQIKTYSY